MFIGLFGHAPSRVNGGEPHPTAARTARPADVGGDAAASSGGDTVTTSAPKTAGEPAESVSRDLDPNENNPADDDGKSDKNEKDGGKEKSVPATDKGFGWGSMTAAFLIPLVFGAGSAGLIFALDRRQIKKDGAQISALQNQVTSLSNSGGNAPGTSYSTSYGGQNKPSPAMPSGTSISA